MQDKDLKLSLGPLVAGLDPGGLDVLLKLLDGVLERGACVVDLVDDEDALAEQVAHLAEAAQVEPLRARDLGPRRLLHRVGRQLLIQRQADGLDGDVGVAGLLEE